MKELIYTGIFVVLGILFIVLFIILFLPDKKDKKEEITPDAETDAVETSYIPGIYTTPMTFSDYTAYVEVIVDRDSIRSVRLINLDEAVTTMYPLIQPSFDALTAQLYAGQTLEDITYPDENKYTSLVLLEAIRTALNKASVTLDAEEGPLH